MEALVMRARRRERDGWPTAAGFLVLRHFMREGIALGRRDRAYVVKRLMTPFLPPYDYVRRDPRRPGLGPRDGSDADAVFCFHDTESHRRSLLHLGLENAHFIRTRDRSTLRRDDAFLGDGVNARIVFGMLAFSAALACAMAWRLARRRQARLADAAVMFGELVVYRYTQRLLRAIPGRPRQVYIADSYSTRSVAVIDFYRSLGVTTNMVQHGLIQGADRYRSHADRYHVWSEFERGKVASKVRSYTSFVYTPAPLTRASTPFESADRHTLLVLNPVQGVGNPYADALFRLLQAIAGKHPITVRLHPLDDAVAFRKALHRHGNADITLSGSTWQEDLDRYSYFMVLNSTCALDIMASGKKVATLAMRELAYAPLKICGAAAIPDIASIGDFVDFRGRAVDVDAYRRILSATLGESHGK